VSSFDTPVPQAPLPAFPQIQISAPSEKLAPASEVATGDADATKEAFIGRQEPAVSLEWQAPPIVKLGQPVTFNILVKNISTTPVQQVVVRTRIPVGVAVQATEPKAVQEVSVLIWDLGTLTSRQERKLSLQLLPQMKGDLPCEALVSFTGSSTTHIRIREPKLLVKVSGPDKVLLGDSATMMLTVQNTGDGPAENVKIRTMLSPGLEHTASSRGIEIAMGGLGPNASRTVQMVCATKNSGIQTCQAFATADGNLKAQATATLEVNLPRLDLAVNGPRLRYLDRHAVYVFKVANPGSLPASNVTVSDQIPEGFKFLSASDGGQHDPATRTASWFIGDLPPGQSRQVSMELVATNTGEQHHRAHVAAARGLKNDAEIVTRVEALSALMMEVTALDNPVEVGADTAYEIRVTNSGSRTESNLQLTCSLPEHMQLRGAQCTANCRFQVQGREIVFEPLPRLAPRGDAVYRVNVRGLAAGDLRFRARISADGMTTPVVKEEVTKVYSDDAVK
jgi:uncharacterized repeat protein (TIGR01451 family)